MARRYLPILGTIVCGALVASCVPGCQFSYVYEVRGTIKNASDRAPLAGVLVTLEAVGLFENSAPTMTGNDGAFSLRFRVSDGMFSPGEMPKWSLTLAKEGYIDEVIDISPSKAPESTKSTNQIVVAAYMKPKP